MALQLLLTTVPAIQCVSAVLTFHAVQLCLTHANATCSGGNQPASIPKTHMLNPQCHLRATQSLDALVGSARLLARSGRATRTGPKRAANKRQHIHGCHNGWIRGPGIEAQLCFNLHPRRRGNHSVDPLHWRHPLPLPTPPKAPTFSRNAEFGGGMGQGTCCFRLFRSFSSDIWLLFCFLAMASRCCCCPCWRPCCRAMCVCCNNRFIFGFISDWQYFIAVSFPFFLLFSFSFHSIPFVYVPGIFVFFK